MAGLLKKAMGKAVLGTALAASTLVAVAPAEAQWGRGYGYRRGGGGDVAAGAILGGILGLGVGAAIANSGRDRYYDRGYYYNAPPRVIYRDPYYAPPRVIYRDRYYAPPVIYRDRFYDRGYYPGYYGW